MADVQNWSTTAASNNAASPDGFSGSMPPSGYDDSCRELMAAIARYRSDTDGVNTTTGSANSYALAASRTMAAYAQGDLFTFKASFTNTGAATLNVDALGAKAIQSHTAALVGGEIVEDGIYTVVYDGTQFQLLNPAPVPVKVLQIVHATDAGSSHSNTNYQNLNNSTKGITPKSANSKLLIEVSFRGRIGNVNGVNAQATFSIYESTAGTALSNEYVLEAFDSDGGVGVGGPVFLRCQVDSVGTSLRTFGLQGKTNNSSGAVGGTLMVWTITEYLT